MARNMGSHFLTASSLFILIPLWRFPHKWLLLSAASSRSIRSIPSCTSLGGSAWALFEPRVHLAQAFDPPLHLRCEAHQVRVELAFDPDGLVGEDLHPQTQ